MNNSTKSKQNIPTLRFPGFEDEWVEKKLGEIIKYIKGYAFKSNEYKDRGIRIIRVSDLTQNNVKETNVMTYIDSESSMGYQKYKINLGDILITTVGSKPYVKESAVGRAIYIKSKQLWLLNQNLVKLKSLEGMSSLFIYLNLSSKKYLNYINLIHRGNANQSNITVEDLLKFKLNLPAYTEQQKIASFLESVDKWIDNLQSQKQKLEEYKKGMMQKIFSQEIRFKPAHRSLGEGGGEDYPEWEEKSAGEIFENYVNKNHSGDLPLLASTQDKGIVYRDQLDLKINSSEQGIKNYKIIDPGNFVISLRSFQGGIEYSTIRGISSPAYTILKNRIEISDLFFKIHFKRENFIKSLNSLIYGIRDGKQISFNEFKTLKLPFPSLPEQQKIADFLTSIDNLIQSQQQKIEKAQKWKKGLMQNLFV